MSSLVIARNSLAELRSRRLVTTVAILSLAFVGLFTAGFSAIYSRTVTQGDDSIVASTILTVLGLYAVHFVTAILAMFVAVGSVSSQLASGTLHAVLARPISRPAWLVQRWLALVALVVVYPTAMVAALLTVARVVAGYGAISPVRAGAMIALEGIVLVSLGLWASSRWSTVTAGVIVFSLFGLGWLAGIVELVGDLLQNTTMQTIGVVVSLIIPTDALWRGGSFYLQSPAFLAMSSAVGGDTAIPFAGNAPPTPAMIGWALLYIGVLVTWAARHFRRRDL